KFLLVVLSDAGQASLSNEQLAAAKGKIALSPWSKIEGTVKIGSKPGANEQVSLWAQEPMADREAPRVYKQYQVHADANGHFVFDRVFPGKYSASRYVQLGANMWGGASSQKFEA